MTHTIFATVDNKPGVVSRVSGLFTRRGYNIESLVTGVTDDPEIYKLTVVLNGTEEEKDLLVAQLERVQEVISVSVAEHVPCALAEMMLLVLPAPDEKARATARTFSEEHALRLCRETDTSLVYEFCASPETLDSIRLAALKTFPGAFSIRSGAVGLALEE
jgi:acetolactate synthase-1/3 small subunit